MDFKILKNKNFSLVVFGELVSMFGSNLQSFALSLYVLKLTGSATKFASVLAIALIPELILAPFAGVFVDRLDRKKIIVCINILNSIVVLFMCFLFISLRTIPMPYIYLSTLLLSLNNVIFSPAIRTIIPSVVKRENLLSANSFNSFVQGVAEIAGPLSAGVILGCSGLFSILVINLVSFILAAIFELFITLSNDRDENNHITVLNFFSDLQEGFKFIKKEYLILAISISAFVINFALPPISNLGFTFISKNILKVSDANYGLMSSIAAIGMILGPVVSGFIPKKVKLTEIFSIGILLVSILIIFMAGAITPLYINLFSTKFIPAFTVTLIISLIIAIIMIINISLSTMFQSIVPNKLLGRVGAVLSVVSNAAHPVGQMVFGSLFDIIPGHYVLIISASILFILLILFRVLVSKNTYPLPVE